MRVTNLHKAALNGDLKKVKELVEAGEDINQKCTDGATPIMHAIVEYNYEVCKYLIEMGADLTIKDEDDMDVMDLAEGDDEITELLKKYI